MIFHVGVGNVEIVADGMLCRIYGIRGASMWDNIMIMYGTLQKETLRFGHEASRFICETPSHNLQVNGLRHSQ